MPLTTKNQATASASRPPHQVRPLPHALETPIKPSPAPPNGLPHVRFMRDELVETLHASPASSRRQTLRLRHTSFDSVRGGKDKGASGRRSVADGHRHCVHLNGLASNSGVQSSPAFPPCVLRLTTPIPSSTLHISTPTQPQPPNP